MKRITFIKMHGLGNDFVIIDSRYLNLSFETLSIDLICNRYRGVGCDQLLILRESNSEADVNMLIFNADGTEAEACGNGLRCVASYVMDLLDNQHVVIETSSGLLPAWRQLNGDIRVSMGIPKFDWDTIPLAEECDPLAAPISCGALKSPTCINIGNPHAVFFVDDADSIDLIELGPELEVHPMFPKRSNIEVVSILDKNTIRMRVWERGVGVTAACGSGACAAMVAANIRGLIGSSARIRLDGGILGVEWEKNGAVFLSGPIATSFSGVIEHPYIKDYMIEEASNE